MPHHRWSGFRRKQWRSRRWGTFKGLIWPLGLLVLFFTGWWWPGILILVGLSMVLDALSRSAHDRAEWQPAPEPPTAPPPAPPPAPPTAPPPADDQAHWEPARAYAPPPPPPADDRAGGEPVAWSGLEPAPMTLPNTCPQCGGPLAPKTTRWLAPNLAECPWCASRLPL